MNAKLPNVLKLHPIDKTDIIKGSNSTLYTHDGKKIAHEVINIINESNIIAESKALGEVLLKELNDIKEGNPSVKAVRGRGLMAAMEFVDPITQLIASDMLDKGFFIGWNSTYNTLRFSPPLTISKEEIVEMTTTLKKIIQWM